MEKELLIFINFNRDIKSNAVINGCGKNIKKEEIKGLKKKIHYIYSTFFSRI